MYNRHMPFFLLMYDVVDDYAEARTKYRDEHLDLARRSHECGDIVLAGAYGEPPKGVVIVFRAESADAAEAFARRDPYVRAGVATGWRVQPWHVVIGGEQITQTPAG